jgi:hypothetical protein
MPQVRQLVTNFLPWGPGFSFRVVHVGFVVDRMILGRDFVRALQLSPANCRSFSDLYPFSFGTGIVGQFEAIIQLLLLAFISKIIMGHEEMQYFCGVVYSRRRKMKGRKCKLLLKKISMDSNGPMKEMEGMA